MEKETKTIKKEINDLLNVELKTKENYINIKSYNFFGNNTTHININTQKINNNCINENQFNNLINTIKEKYKFYKVFIGSYTNKFNGAIYI